MRKLAFVALAVPLAVAGAALAQSPEAVPVAYVSAKVNQSGATVVMLVPRPLDRFDPARLGDSVLHAFDALKLAHAYEYGKATLLLDGDPARTRRVTLNLDPERRDFFDVVASEVYYTMKSLGVSDVRAPALREAPLDDFALRTPVFRLAVPFYDALPPRSLAGALVVLSPVDLMPSEMFAYKLKQGDRELTDRVLGGLNSPSEIVRLAVIASLPHLSVPARAPVLLPRLSDSSTGVRIAALKLLENENTREVNDRLGLVVENDPDATVKLTAARMLSSRNIKKYDVFIELERLSDPDDKVVAATIERLAAAKNPAVGAALAQSLRHRSPIVREAARKGIVTLGASGLMVAAMNDDHLDAGTRESFARMLAEAGGADEPAAIAWLLASGTTDGAAWAAARVGEKRPADGLKGLYGALLRPESPVRVAAIKGVGNYRQVSSIRPLLGAAKTPDERAAVEAVVTAIIASQNLDAVLALMDDPDVTTRRLAMKALGDSLKGAAPPTRAVSVLQARLSDPDLGVRRAAVYALARVPDERVTASIMALSGDADGEIREAAVVAAARSQDPKSADVLVKALNDESDKVKMVALDAVAARQVKSARESLQMMAQYRDVGVRRKAMKAYLAMLAPGEAEQLLDFLFERLYDTDPEVKLSVLAVIKGVHERRAIVAMSGLVIDPNREVRIAAIDALAATGEKDALEGVEKAVFDSDKAVRLHALDALGTLGRKEALDFLSELLNLEHDAEVRAKAQAVQKALLDR
ncbi:MAG: HEAT repeat domain-containing protein [Deltaproteobacteria bacterium]|nr:HEAT repeat domain-containing protein [Deltaproteobacteria bacterium]